MFDTIPTVGTFRLPPDSAGTVRAVARIGYELPEALADIIDNSIDAHARTVTVTFLRDDERILAVLIGDDGDGMDAATLEQAMQFGVSAHHKVTDLGTFGLGMKSASFSQCRSMTVVSRRDGRIAACRWTTELIGNDWSCARLDPSAARSLFERGFTAADKVPATGTVVAWDRLERLGVPQGDLEPFLSKMFQNLSLHFGLYFHRFLSKRSLTLVLVAGRDVGGPSIPHVVQAYDPFGYATTGNRNYPKTFTMDLPGTGALDLIAHVWPPNSAAPEFRLGRRNPTGLQGLYFYRNNRLVQAGGWNEFIKDSTDPELSLARIRVDLPVGGGPTINVQKSAVQVSAGLVEALEEARCGKATLRDYMEDCRRVYRKAARQPPPNEDMILVAGEGLPAGLRRSLEDALSPDLDLVRPINFEWAALNRKQVFDLDLDNDTVLLNKRYRNKILDGKRASAVDAPLFKALLFLLLRHEFDRERFSAKRREWLDECNLILLKAVTTL